MSELKNHLKRMGTPIKEEEVLLAEIEGTIMGRLLTYRKENGLTQKQLAKRLGVSQVMVSKLENGKFNPTVKHLNHIAHVLGGTLTVDLVLPEEQEPYQELMSILRPTVKTENSPSISENSFQSAVYYFQPRVSQEVSS